MIKILYVVSTLKRCGPVNILYSLIKYLNRATYRPAVITLSPESKDSRWQDFEEVGVNLYTLGLSRIKGLFCVNSKIKRIISELDVDVVHTHGIRADSIAAKHLDKNRTVSTLHNYPFYDYPMTYGKAKGRLIAWHHFKMLQRIKHPVAVSKSVCAMLLEKNNFAVDTIQNGVDTDIFHPVLSTKAKQQLRQKLGIVTDKEVFITTGHLSSRKDPLTIIKAFQNESVNVKCLTIFLGDGPLRLSCERAARKNNLIRFMGRVANVSEYLQASDFFVSASRAEGFPNAVMEAMACGLPCLLSDIGPHMEIMEYNSKSGNLFKTRNADALAKKINEILSKNYQDISGAAVSIIRENLNAKVMSEKYQNLYRKICTA